MCGNVCTGCHKLKHHDLLYCYEISDTGIKHTTECWCLKILKLTSVHFKGMYYHLISSHLVHLIRLSVVHYKKLSEGVIDKLQEELPHFRIMWECNKLQRIF